MDENELDQQSPDDVFLTAVLFECALAVVAVFLGWSIGPSARAMVPSLELAQWWPLLSGVLYGLLATVPVLLFIEIVRRIPWEPIRELERFSDDGMMKTLLQLRSSELILISLCAGIGEELLFRGWLMYGVLAVCTGWLEVSPQAGMATALVFSSVVFGLFHPITKLYVVLATLIGLYFGALVLFTGNLLIPITAHAAYDAFQLIMTARAGDQQDSIEAV
ncbi:MAG: lysostaphin resistance A-like protein [Rubripirellula sp.]